VYFRCDYLVAMFIRILALLFLGLSFTSCDYFSSTSSTSKSNIQVLDTVVDFTSVDVYPIFSDCENYAENTNQKQCFEETLTNLLSDSLLKNDFKVKEEVNDTTLIDILIDNSGKVSVVKINSSESIKKQLPKLDTIIKQSVAEFPTIKPAVKRGIFVNSQYRLAIVIETI